MISLLTLLEITAFLVLLYIILSHAKEIDDPRAAHRPCVEESDVSDDELYIINENSRRFNKGGEHMNIQITS